MDVTINGRPSSVAPHTTVAEVVASLTRSAGGVAVALNDEVVRRADWATTVVAENDRIDVLTAVQGG
ncbi:sulfur carrier protein ThiS [Streptomonospora sp. S1-112]|uniref:Sulfur carrier protein ThiS n=1 Tax=Streptomonospora mangrovi TaxID=2883123 RepID=A0A9X3NW82_9ACTN|nr:sulfur carrier protein ThiS [Streptomonospora mangrovi]MDA0565416.1 sulfur carrier protein ThiS [Streptomonospora mangrovi]